MQKKLAHVSMQDPGDSPSDVNVNKLAINPMIEKVMKDKLISKLTFDDSVPLMINLLKDGFTGIGCKLSPEGFV